MYDWKFDQRLSDMDVRGVLIARFTNVCASGRDVMGGKL